MTADSGQRRRAIEETDRSFVVEASAGTGKTTLLIRRILHCVLEHGPERAPLPLARICAITFTEKAAGEMKIRLRQEFEAKAMAGGDLGRRASEALVDLESATISTFHAFAVSLLKERPIEAGLDPRFTALDDVQSELLFQEVWDTWLHEAIQARRAPLESALRAGLGLEPLQAVARTIRLHAGTIRKLRLPAPPAEEETRRHLEELLRSGRELLARVRLMEDKLLPHLDAALAWATDPSRQALPSKPGGKGAAGNWQGGKDTVEEVRDYVKSVVEYGAQYRLFPVQRALDGVLRLVIDEFLPKWDARKRADGLLDFDDMLDCMRDLLRTSRAARSEFQKRYSALLVDEFQDTDPIQWEIVSLLTGGGEEASDPGTGAIAPGRLFVVGDPKQSIYRFRGADIETYLEVSAPEYMGKLGLERLELTTNFRSVPPILGFVDEAFRDAMSRAGSKPYQPDYLAFGGQGDRPGRAGHPCVHLLGDRMEDGRPAGSGPDYYKIEAKRIAGLIATMRGDAVWEVQAGRSQAWRPPGFRDIAILLPVLTHADALEEALRDAGIPYVLEGGKFYYARSEVSSAITVLRAVSNPNDTVALYGALRSIFFGISDEDLLRARIDGVELDYRNEAPDGSQLRRAFRILHELHLRRHERMASETLESLLQQTGAREVLALRGVQSLANLNKLVRTLRSLQQDATFSEVVDLVGGMDEEGIAESESRVMEEHSDAVRILSIHRAKGLDFPIVIVAGLGIRRLSRQADFLADAHGRGTFALRAGAKETGLQTPAWAALADEEKEREEAELVRLLYVALTRARDHLVLSVHTRGRRLPGSDLWQPAFEPTRLKPLADFLLHMHGRENPPARYLDAAALGAGAGDHKAGGTSPAKAWEEALADQYGKLRRLLSDTPQARGFHTATAAEEEGAEEEAAPDFARDRAARIGVAFHEAMSAMDLKGTPDIERLAGDSGARQRLDRAGTRLIGDMLRGCLASPLLERVRCCLISGGQVWRELPYIRPLGPEKAELEEGKIDLLFQEGGGWVLVDYKTDRIPAEAEPALFFANKYAGQIHAYVDALKALGVPVKSAYLLLIRTGAEIELPV